MNKGNSYVFLVKPPLQYGGTDEKTRLNRFMRVFVSVSLPGIVTTIDVLAIINILVRRSEQKIIIQRLTV